MEQLFLGIDQGSSSTKGVLLDSFGQHYHEGAIPVSTHTDGEHVEQNAHELARSVQLVADDAIRLANRLKRNIAAIGLSVQRSGVCAWEQSSLEVLHPLLSHRDTRTGDRIAALSASHSFITERTGLPVVARYAGAKIALLQEQFPDPQVRVGTLDSFIVQRFAGDTRFLTEDSMAARSMLYDLQRGTWDGELCNLFGVQESRLPQIGASLGQHGTYRGIPITAMLGDQQAGLFGRLVEGIPAVLNLGTISSVCVATGNSIVRRDGFVSSVLYSEGGNQREFNYLLEAVTNCSGPIVELLHQRMRVAPEVPALNDLCLKAGEIYPIAYFPMGSTGTPHWLSEVPNLISGWDKVNQAAFVRAVLENIGNFLAQNMLALQQAEIIPPGQGSIAVSGGLSDLDYLMQYISDVTGFNLVRLGSREAAARGAAIAALQHYLKGRGKLPLPRDQERRIFAPQDPKPRARYEAWMAIQEQARAGNWQPDHVFDLS
ncbi:MAG: hypothetical protein K1X79_01515 [Oligoflexia bacterium]|nr:hypothetical protein [Oligoflexia bacterium]